MDELEFDDYLSLEYPQRVVNLIQELEGKLIEREELIRLILICIFSKNHAFLIGEAGTGKTYAVQVISNAISDGVFWEKLLSHNTQETEIIGETLGKANFAFFDEMFKAPEKTLNGLLGVINERVIHCNGETINIPLNTLYSASNEFPNGSEIEPFVDRLLLWYEVRVIQKRENKIRYEKGQFDKSKTIKNSFTMAEVDYIWDLASKVAMDEEHSNLFMKIKDEMKRTGLKCSDRKFGGKYIIQALRVSALLNGRNKLNFSDFVLIRHYGWDNFHTRKILLEVLSEVIYGSKTDIKRFLIAIDKNVRKVTGNLDSELFLFLRNKEEIKSALIFEEKIKKCHKAMEMLEKYKEDFLVYQNLELHNEKIDRECEENIFVLSMFLNPFHSNDIRELMRNIDGRIVLYENTINNFLEKNESFFAYQEIKNKQEKGEEV